MEIIVLLIVIGLVVAGGFLFAFFWAVRDGQYDDDLTPSMRILIEDDAFQKSEKTQNVK